MTKELTIIVEEMPNVHKRLDKYLFAVLNQAEWTRTRIQKLIAQQLILVNNVNVTSNYNVQYGDQITIKVIAKQPWKMLSTAHQNLDIIFEDEYLLVINKPKNLVVHPGAGNWENTLVNVLLAKNIKLSKTDDETRPGIVHRLDKDTTGLLVVAKDSVTHQFLTKQLQNKTLTRKYFALVHGIINNEDNLVDGPIGRDPKNRKKMAIVFKNSREAQTKFRVLKRYVTDNMTFIECELVTGRMHQIRVHLSSIKHPIVGDHIYGTRKDLNEEYAQYLHAHEIEFVHPSTEEKMKFNCNLPVKFQEKLQSLS